MIRKENETKNVEVIKDVVCNSCGRGCKTGNNFEFATLKAHWGYDSDDRDGEIHEAHLCQSCWESIVKEFKHSGLIAENQL
jgi:hypothetical protein